MPKKRELRSTTSPLSETWDWCKSTAGTYQDNEFEVGRLTKVTDRLQIDFRGDRIEFDRFFDSLNAGDRVRILCDDGVLVVEKKSQTQFELVHAEAMAHLVH
jgi:hypothetical protein